MALWQTLIRWREAGIATAAVESVLGRFGRDAAVLEPAFDAASWKARTVLSFANGSLSTPKLTTVHGSCSVPSSASSASKLPSFGGALDVIFVQVTRDPGAHYAVIDLGEEWRVDGIEMTLSANVLDGSDYPAELRLFAAVRGSQSAIVGHVTDEALCILATIGACHAGQGDWSGRGSALKARALEDEHVPKWSRAPDVVCRYVVVSAQRIQLADVPAKARGASFECALQ